MRFPKHIAGFAAFVGVWFCFGAIGQDVLKIESFGWIMVWGVLALIVASWTERWIRKPSKAKGGVRGR